MNNLNKISLLILLALFINLTGCMGSYTFTTAARPGETVALTVGNLGGEYKRQDISIDILAGGQFYPIPAGDPNIRALINTYVDPLSKVVIGSQTGQNIDGQEITWGNQIMLATGDDKEWYQSLLFFNLPDDLPAGTAFVIIKNTNGDTLGTPPITVLDKDLVGTSAANTFGTNGGPIPDEQMQSMERPQHYEITFNGATVPHAIEINMDHTNGVGIAYVVNPRGDIKNISWSDTGSQLKVILMPAKNTTLGDFKDFKFYVAGGITGLVETSTGLLQAEVSGFDVSGTPIAEAITMTITNKN